jgi:Ras-related protein Rab-11A
VHATSATINRDFIFKIVLGGTGGVGKTTLIHRFLTKEFMDDTKLTVGVSFQAHALERYGRKINIIFYDLGGQERFRFLQNDYMRGAVAAFLCFDLSRLSTLQDLERWVPLVRDNSAPDAAIILVGTKMDLVEPERLRPISEHAIRFARDQGFVGYLPTSSKSGENIEEVVDRIVDYLLYQKTGGQIGADVSLASTIEF